MFERYFYHSFPRRANCNIGHGLQILRSMVKNGLLLTPERTDFNVWFDSLLLRSPASENRPLPEFAKQGVVPAITEEQLRVCFTELPPPEADTIERKLFKHSEFFGQFALEFNADALRQIGALPVHYLPMTLNGSSDQTVGFELLVRLTFLRSELAQEELRYSDPDWSRIYPPTLSKWDEHYWEDRENDQFDGKVVTTEEKIRIKHLSLVKQIDCLNHLLSLCYPMERTPEDESMRYFQQREWRIAPHLLPKTACKKLTSTQSNELLALDAEFFGRVWDEKPWANPVRLVDKCVYYQGPTAHKIFRFVRRVFSPPECVEEVRRIINDAGFETEVKGLK